MNPRISNIITALNDNIDNLQNTCRKLKPVLQENMDITMAIKSYCQKYTEMIDIKIELFISIKSRPSLVYRGELIQDITGIIMQYSQTLRIKKRNNNTV